MVTQNCDRKRLPSVLGHENQGFIEICGVNLKNKVFLGSYLDI